MCAFVCDLLAECQRKPSIFNIEWPYRTPIYPQSVYTYVFSHAGLGASNATSAAPGHGGGGDGPVWRHYTLEFSVFSPIASTPSYVANNHNYCGRGTHEALLGVLKGVK